MQAKQTSDYIDHCIRVIRAHGHPLTYACWLALSAMLERTARG